MPQESKEMYSVPARFRSIENMHILFWLVKDICWCLEFRPLGILMIFPTLFIALYITWRNRQVVSELTHNIAIALWIIANSMWMIVEFMGIDEQFRLYSLIPFSLGILIMLYYYLIYSPLHRKKQLIEPVVVEP